MDLSSRTTNQVIFVVNLGSWAGSLPIPTLDVVMAAESERGKVEVEMFKWVLHKLNGFSKVFLSVAGLPQQLITHMQVLCNFYAASSESCLRQFTV